MKDKITKYYCDVCGKEVESNECLYKYKIPVAEKVLWCYFDGVTKIKICAECRDALKNAIRKGFAKINTDWSGNPKIEEVVYKRGEQNDG